MGRIKPKPYEARLKLKSIYYWQLVASGHLPPKRKLTYYVHKLRQYTPDRIKELEAIAAIRLDSKGREII